MKAEAFIRAVGGISDDKIVKYSDVHPAVYSGSVQDKKAAGGNKRLLWVAAAAALVVAFGIFAVVRFSKTPGGEKQALVSATEPAEQTTPAPTASPTQPTAASEPPQQIVFSSMAAYREFAAAAELDDWAFAEFLRSPRNSYEMNGISVKEDAVRVLNTLGSLPMPVLEDFVFDCHGGEIAAAFAVAVEIELDDAPAAGEEGRGEVFEGRSAHVVGEAVAEDGKRSSVRRMIIPSAEDKSVKGTDAHFFIRPGVQSVDQLDGMVILLLRFQLHQDMVILVLPAPRGIEAIEINTARNGSRKRRSGEHGPRRDPAYLSYICIHFLFSR